MCMCVCGEDEIQKKRDFFMRFTCCTVTYVRAYLSQILRFSVWYG